MAAVVPDVGEILALSILLDTPHSMQIRLFKNDATPYWGSVLEDLEEADFPGYGATNIDQYPDPITSGTGRAKLTRNNIQFIHSSGTGANTIYGWYITAVRGTDDPQLLMLKKFTTPITVTDNGDKVAFDLDLFCTEVAS